MSEEKKTLIKFLLFILNDIKNDNLLTTNFGIADCCNKAIYRVPQNDLGKRREPIGDVKLTKYFYVNLGLKLYGLRDTGR